MKIIECPSPNCGQLQVMEWAQDSRLYYPVPPYCCEIMEMADSPKWNQQLDDEIEKAQTILLT